MRLFREVLPAEGEHIYPRRFDLLIVDEAANIAPAGSGRYATTPAHARAGSAKTASGRGGFGSTGRASSGGG